jgi:hypothetical protein
MTLSLTPEILAAAYDYLHVTPPFAGWNLPESEDVKFKVSRRRSEYARYQWNGEHHIIEISQRGVGFTRTLIEKMAHEMIHLYLEIMGWESKDPSPDVHNAAFQRFAAQVCKIHGWDPKAFY